MSWQNSAETSVPLTLLISPAPVDTAAFARAATLRNATSAKDQLAHINQWLEVALNNMARGLSMFDAEQRLLLCNNAYKEIYNLPDELTQPGTALKEIVRYHASRESGKNSPEDTAAEQAWIDRHVAELAKGSSFSHTQHLACGRTILVTNQPLTDGSWVDLQEDITERCLAEQKIAWLARHDALTEIPNRFHFHEQLDLALQELPPGGGLAVHWIDLDRFKDVNDGLGHPVGDALLKSLGARLYRQIRSPDFVGRLGGDEFAIVQSGVTDVAQAVAFVERLLAMFSEPHQLLGHSIDIGASVGIALAPQHGMSADELLKQADIALYQAKSRGRGTFAVFNPEFCGQDRTRRQLEVDLKGALHDGQLELHYQPIRDVATHKATSCEALMRWHHPLHGLIPPSDFIPIAEEMGLIVAMGDWALHRACKDAVTWPGHVAVTVNVSASQFTKSDLYETVQSALRMSGLPATRLELEITESVLLRDDAATIATLHRLRALGVRIALDDFGTAFASLSYLRSFPFDTIKIDRSFVRDLPTRADCAAIISAVTGLARKLNMNSVVEGVETFEQLAAVSASGCDEVQGYYFNRPVPASSVALLLDKDKEQPPTAC
jgi:diguanylate cyclase (GGDEF)-like protein